MVSPEKRARYLPARWQYFWSNAPFAMAASALPGTVNYGFTLMLVYVSGFEAAGQFRVLLSAFSLLGLASMIETRKVFISALVAGDRAAISSLFINRIYFLGAAFLVVTAMAFGSFLSGSTGIPVILIAVAALACPIFAFDLYLPALQAESRFNRLFAYELIKYGASATAFLATYWGYRNVEWAVLAMLATIGFCHLLFFMMITRTYYSEPLSKRSLQEHLTAPAAKQARTYSFANMLPASMEHADKLLVGWVFGLEFLGIYALAYSTGRFFYNAIKPAFYIYYRRFVDAMPSRKVLFQIGLLFSIIGTACAIAFIVAVATIPAMAKFESGSVVTVILFLSYGIGMIRAVYGQAFILNKNTEAAPLFNASIIASLASLTLLAAALMSPPTIALILLALQYPLRDGLTTILLARLGQSGP